jgi:hypothetical protein
LDIGKTFVLNFKDCVNLEKSLSGRAHLPVAHDGPWPCVPASVRPRSCGDTAVAQSPHTILHWRCQPTAHHLYSTRSPCSHRLHVSAASLSMCTYHAEAPFPSSHSQQPPISHPTLLSSPFASGTAVPVADRASHHYCHRP